jgi:hypothetical protein
MKFRLMITDMEATDHSGRAVCHDMSSPARALES